MNIIRQLRERLFDRSHSDEIVMYTTYAPCVMCFGALLMVGIRKVVAGVDLDDSGIVSYINHIPRGFRNEAYATQIRVGVLGYECAKVWLDSQPAQRLIGTGYVLSSSLDDLKGDVAEYKAPVDPGVRR